MLVKLARHVIIALFVLVTAGSCAAGFQVPKTGTFNRIEGVLVRLERSQRVGVLYNVGSPLQDFIAVKAPADDQAYFDFLVADAFPLAEGQRLPASTRRFTFGGMVVEQDGHAWLVVETKTNGELLRLTDDELDHIQRLLAARALSSGSEQDRAAVDQLVRSGLMRELLHEAMNFVAFRRELKGE